MSKITSTDDLCDIDSLLPAIIKIFGCWRLNEEQQLTLLGLGPEVARSSSTKNLERVVLSRNMLERSSYILGVYKSLQILFPDPAHADNWLTTLNDNPLFHGTAPLDRMLSGQTADLAVVRNFLDAQCNAQ